MANIYTYQVPATNGLHIFPSRNRAEPYHILTFRQNGTATAGTMTIETRPRGADEFIPITIPGTSGTPVPLTDLDLTNFTAFQSGQWTGDVLEYRITFAALAGINSLTMTDITHSYGGST